MDESTHKKLNLLLDAIEKKKKNESEHTVPEPETSLVCELENGTVKVSGTVKETYHTSSQGRRVTTRSVDTSINLDKYSSIYIEHNKVYGIDVGKQAVCLNLGIWIRGEPTPKDDDLYLKVCQHYIEIRKKKEIARDLMMANPFFSKEDLLRQVEVLYAALGEIK